MNLFSKYSLTLVIILSITASSFAQIDSLKSKKINAEINATVGTKKLKANSVKNKVAPNTNIDLTINKQLNTDAINKNLKKYSSNNTNNFLMETLPENKNIRDHNYFRGVDYTNKGVKSNMSLGTISTKSKTVRVECRDHSYVDGDIIKIYLNEQPLKNNIVLKKSRFVVYLQLKKGYNRIDFQAMNEGLSGPNTAELLLYDENDNLISAKGWNLLTGATATLGVIQTQ